MLMKELHTTLCVCVDYIGVLLCVCVDYICVLLCVAVYVIVSMCVCIIIHALHGKFEVVSWIYE